MTTKTPPAAWDRRALETARHIASIDRARLPGLTTQFVAILQSAMVELMMRAAEETHAEALSRIQTLIAQGELDEPAHSERNGIVHAFNAVHQAGAQS